MSDSESPREPEVVDAANPSEEQAEQSPASPEQGAADPASGAIEPMGPVLADALGRVLAVARVQARSRFEDAAKRARRRLDFFQARRDLDRLYQKLGREVVQLVEAGEVTHPGLIRGVERIQQQESLVSDAAEQLGTTPEALAEE